MNSCLREPPVQLTVLIDSLRRHGTQSFLAMLAEGLCARGHALEVWVLNDAIDPALQSALAGGGARVRILGRRWLLARAGPMGLARELRKRRDGVILTLLPWADTLGRWAAHHAGCTRIVSSIRARNIDKPAWQCWLDRRTMPWARKVIFNSREVVAWSRANEGVREDQVVVIPNGVAEISDPQGMRRTATRRRLGLAENDFLVGAVGRLYPQKDYPTLLRAFAQLAGARPSGVKLCIIGDGPLRAALEALARELGISTRVHWAGQQEVCADWYPAFDAFLHTATFEGMPNSLLEAMSAGLPVVVGDADGCRELVTDGQTGRRVPCGQPAAFAHALRDLLDDPAHAAKLGTRAKQLMLTNYSVEKMIDHYESTFKSLWA